jgi:non-heme chloroperoxidase
VIIDRSATMSAVKAKAFWSLLLLVFLCATVPGALRAAADVEGAWQGTLQAKNPLRLILKISRDDKGALTGSLYSIDQTPDPIAATSVIVDGTTLTVTISPIHGTYVGTLSADGNSIIGTWTQGRSFPLSFQRATKATAWPIDPAVQKTQFVTVDPGVQLEVLDWGGTGKPIVLLAGEGDTAHIFSREGFAHALTAKYHVYGITRRGYGESSKPAPTHDNYSSDRLGDDVVAVIDALHLDRPVLIGHSVAGEELSSVGTHHPNSVSGLVYLDSGYAYALYDVHASDDTRAPYDTEDVIDDLQLNQSEDLATQMAAANRLLTELPRLQNDIALEKTIDDAIAPRFLQSAGSGDPIGTMIDTSGARYTGPIPVPILAVYASPHDWRSIQGTNAAANAAATEAEHRDTLTQIAAFKKHLPNATIVVIPNADHYVFVSNQKETLNAINAFLDRVWP